MSSSLSSKMRELNITKQANKQLGKRGMKGKRLGKVFFSCANEFFFIVFVIEGDGCTTEIFLNIFGVT